MNAIPDIQDTKNIYVDLPFFPIDYSTRLAIPSVAFNPYMIINIDLSKSNSEDKQNHLTQDTDLNNKI